MLDDVSHHKLVLFECQGICQCVSPVRSQFTYNVCNAHDACVLDNPECCSDNYQNLYSLTADNVELWNLFRTVVTDCLR